MTLFSVISSFLMKMVFDQMQKGASECAPLPPKGELLVDLKSCHLAGDPDCSSLGVGAGHWVRKRPRWRCSYRFSSATTLRHAISAVSACHWRSLAFSPKPWLKWKAQTKAPSFQWLFRWPLGAGHCTDSLLAMQGVSPALFAAPFFKPLTYEVSRITSWLLLLHRRSPSHQPVA